MKLAALPVNSKSKAAINNTADNVKKYGLQVVSLVRIVIKNLWVCRKILPGLYHIISDVLTKC